MDELCSHIELLWNQYAQEYSRMIKAWRTQTIVHSDHWLLTRGWHLLERCIEFFHLENQFIPSVLTLNSPSWFHIERGVFNREQHIFVSPHDYSLSWILKTQKKHNISHLLWVYKRNVQYPTLAQRVMFVWGPEDGIRTIALWSSIVQLNQTYCHLHMIKTTEICKKNKVNMFHVFACLSSQQSHICWMLIQSSTTLHPIPPFGVVAEMSLVFFLFCVCIQWGRGQ